jgi:integrase
VNGDSDCYDPATGTIHIRKTLKTPAAARTVLLPKAFAAWLNARITSSGELFPQTYQQVHDTLKSAGLPLAHAYRRYRITHLRKAGMNESVLRRQVGHSDPSVTSRYDRSGTDEAFVRVQVESAGIGFTLPNQEKEKAAVYRVA